MAKNTFGTKFKLDLGSGMVAVASIKDVGDLDTSADTYDRTTHESPDGHKEKGKGLREVAPITLELLFDQGDAGHQELEARSKASEDTPEPYEIELPSSIGKTKHFNAFVTGFKESTPIDGDNVAMVEFTPSGKATTANTTP